MTNTYTTKTLFGGMVAIPDRIVLRNRRRLLDLIVYYDGKQMTIKRFKKPDSKGEILQDKWGRKNYRLYYYNFVPDKPKTQEEKTKELLKLGVFG